MAPGFNGLWSRLGERSLQKGDSASTVRNPPSLWIIKAAFEKAGNGAANLFPFFNALDHGLGGFLIPDALDARKPHALGA